MATVAADKLKHGGTADPVGELQEAVSQMAVGYDDMMRKVAEEGSSMSSQLAEGLEGLLIRLEELSGLLEADRGFVNENTKRELDTLFEHCETINCVMDRVDYLENIIKKADTQVAFVESAVSDAEALAASEELMAKKEKIKSFFNPLTTYTKKKSEELMEKMEKAKQQKKGFSLGGSSSEGGLMSRLRGRFTAKTTDGEKNPAASTGGEGQTQPGDDAVDMDGTPDIEVIDNTRNTTP